MNSLEIIVFIIGLALAVFGLRHKISNIDFDKIGALLWTFPIVAAYLPLVLFLLAWIFDALNLDLLNACANGALLLTAFAVAPAVGFTGAVVLLLNYWSGQISFRQHRICLAAIFTCLDVIPCIPIIVFVVRVLFFGLYLDS